MAAICSESNRQSFGVAEDDPSDATGPRRGRALAHGGPRR